METGTALRLCPFFVPDCQRMVWMRCCLNPFCIRFQSSSASSLRQMVRRSSWKVCGQSGWRWMAEIVLAALSDAASTASNCATAPIGTPVSASCILPSVVAPGIRQWCARGIGGDRGRCNERPHHEGVAGVERGRKESAPGFIRWIRSGGLRWRHQRTCARRFRTPPGQAGASGSSPGTVGSRGAAGNPAGRRFPRLPPRCSGRARRPG